MRGHSKLTNRKNDSSNGNGKAEATSSLIELLYIKCSNLTVVVKFLIGRYDWACLLALPPTRRGIYIYGDKTESKTIYFKTTRMTEGYVR